ncbi:MAG: shikimate dehydrogenase [Verrucomicrobia bacterium]|nr:shikimate dehydrogenase [Verrucomicrobiota bacterium]
MRPIVYVLNGPNLNLLGSRQPEIYGRETLADVEAECRRLGADLGLEIEFRQTNAEFQLIDWIHESRKRAAGIVINPAALTHTSVAVLDALNACECPILEVHISNIHKREEFRHHSFVSQVATGVICGFGAQGYFLAIQHLARLIGSPRAATVQTQSAFLVGLIGAGIQASLTPAMHEREGAAQGLHYVYRLIDLQTLGLGVEALAGLITAAGQMGFTGLNVTHPCKQAVIPLLDELSDDARSLEAVNTVVFKDGKRVGHNTDWFGFAENFRRGLPDARRDHVVQLGAGGAGSAVAHAALTCGVKKLTIVDTVAERAKAVAAGRAARFGPDRVSVADPAEIAAPLATADGLINTTPIGMAKYPGLPLSAALLRPELWVAEIIYFPLETDLLRAARALGCRTLDGGGMAVFQAAEAFRLFTGIEPDTQRMLQHFAALCAK